MLADIRSFAPDIVHAHFAYPDGVVATRLGSLLNVPTVITEHNFWRPQMAGRPAVAAQAVRAVADATRFVCVSGAVLRSVESVMRRAIPASIIPIGVDPGIFIPKSSRGIDPLETRLLFVGWLREVKGMETLLRAVSLLRQKRPNVLLDVVGGDLLGDHASAAATLSAAADRHGIRDIVRFQGPRSPEGVAEAMRSAHLLVVASERESCGAALLESIASGTPVVSTRCGGPEEFITAERGALVPIGDVEALSSACDAVLTRAADFSPQDLHRSVAERYSWNELARQYLVVYRGAITLADDRRIERKQRNGE